MNATRDLHTNASTVPNAVVLLRKSIKLVNQLSTSLAIKLVTKLFCKPTRRKIGKKQKGFYESGKTDVLRINGYKIKVFRKGSGPAIYLAHGWNSFGYDMRHLVKVLVAEGYQVIMPDMPCHGRSSGMFINQIEMSKVIKTILLHYNAKSPIEKIITYSWGGTASLLAVDQIRKEQRQSFNIQKIISVSMPARPNAIMDLFIQLLDLPQTVAKGFIRNIELMAEKDGRSLKEAFPIGLSQLMESASFDYLLMHGMADTSVPFESSVQLAARFPHIQTHFFKGLGHFNIMKNRAVLNTIVSQIRQKAPSAISKRGLVFIS